MTYLILQNHDFNDIDYEHLDDLPLEEHVEWGYSYNRETIDLIDGQDEWLTD